MERLPDPAAIQPLAGPRREHRILGRGICPKRDQFRPQRRGQDDNVGYQAEVGGPKLEMNCSISGVICESRMNKTDPSS